MKSSQPISEMPDYTYNNADMSKVKHSIEVLQRNTDYLKKSIQNNESGIHDVDKCVHILDKVNVQLNLLLVQINDELLIGALLGDK